MRSKTENFQLTRISMLFSATLHWFRATYSIEPTSDKAVRADYVLHRFSRMWLPAHCTIERNLQEKQGPMKHTALTLPFRPIFPLPSDQAFDPFFFFALGGANPTALDLELARLLRRAPNRFLSTGISQTSAPSKPRQRKALWTVRQNVAKFHRP